MADSAKRLLTDERYNAHVLTDQFQASPDISDELTQRLRNAGSRVRKSVTEGYRTTPSSFSKAQSTGSIFRSMNDTLRDVYANAPDHVPTNDATRKRARSISESVAEPIPEDPCEIIVDPLPPSGSTTSVPPVGQPATSSRQIKPLRAPSRAFLATRSLPAGALSFAGSSTAQPPSIMPATEEEDWSQENCFQPSQPSFEPMNFD